MIELQGFGDFVAKSSALSYYGVTGLWSNYFLDSMLLTLSLRLSPKLLADTFFVAFKCAIPNLGEDLDCSLQLLKLRFKLAYF